MLASVEDDGLMAELLQPAGASEASNAAADDGGALRGLGERWCKRHELH